MPQLVKNKLRVCHFAQVPCKPFIVNVENEYEAVKIINILASQHLFLYEQDIIPDYSNVLTVEMWDDEENDWISYFNENELMEWEEFESVLSEGAKVEDLIRQGVVELRMFDTSPEHAKQYGLDSKNPLYIHSIFVAKEERRNDIGSKVLGYVIDYAIKNEHDVIFGHITQKAFGHITQKAEPNIDVIKSMLVKSGFSTCEGNDSFYKKLDLNEQFS